MGIKTETVMGSEIRVPGARIYPFAHISAWTGQTGGLIWNRPAAILVQADDGEEEVLLIRDITRELQIRVLLFGLIGSLLIWLIGRNLSKS